jgi:hypothetical protein
MRRAKKESKFFIVLLLLMFFCWTSNAAQNDVTVIEDRYSSLILSLSQAIITENDNLNSMEEQYRQTGTIKKILASEIEAYKILISSQTNILLLPQSKVKDLEQALSDLFLAIRNIQIHLKDFKKKLDFYGQAVLLRDEQEKLNQERYAALDKKDQAEKNIGVLLDKYKKLLLILKKERKYLGDIKIFYGNKHGAFEKIENDILELSKKVEGRIKERKKQNLFKRKGNLLNYLNIDEFKKESARLLINIRRNTDNLVFIDSSTILLKNYGYSVFSVIIIFIFWITLLIRTKRLLSKVTLYSPWDKRPWCTVFIKLFQSSLPLSGTFFYFYILSKINHFFIFHRFLSLTADVFLVFLISRWCLESMALLPGDGKKEDFRFVIFHTRIFIYLVRYLSIGYLFLGLFLGEASVVLFLVRITAGIRFCIWNILFWKNLKHKMAAIQKPASEKKRWFRPILAV